MPDLTVLASEVGHACFGFEALGLCAYDPAKPYTVYFAPGAAIGALAFTLAVQQLLKAALTRPDETMMAMENCSGPLLLWADLYFYLHVGNVCRQQRERTPCY
jgi:hypothetical protein